MSSERNREARVPEEPRGNGGRTAGAPRTLAEELRTRPDEELAALLRARPDLLHPVPGDITQLATRAGTRASVVRALERLDRFALQTAEALAVAPDPCPSEVLLGLMAGDDGDDEVAAALPRAVAALRTHALVWGGNDRLHLVRTARELLSPGAASGSRAVSPTGLGPTVAEACAGMSPNRLQDILAAAGLPATHDPVTAVASLTALFEDRKRMADLLAQAPPEAQAMLNRLAWGPPYGTISAPAPTPVRWLTARGLLLPAGTGTVVLPREAALHLRGGRAHRVCEPRPPEVLIAAQHRPKTVDATAAGQAHTALATVEELLQDWETGGPAVLRAGGLSSRDLKRAASAHGMTPDEAAFWLELAHGAGLLASDSEADERFAPTPAYDAWLQDPAADRWAVLAEEWLAATRTPGVVGATDAKGRVLSVLGPGLDRSPAPEVRARVLGLLAGLPEGAAAEPGSLLARLRWEHGLPREEPAAPDDAAAERRRPGRPGHGPGDRTAEPTEDLRTRLARWTLADCERLGVTGRGALAVHGRALLEQATAAHDAPGAREPAPGRAARALAPLLPQPVDHILIQADLTAVAPGPLERPLAETMAALADVESTGGATVYRFTAGSVRRALDSGRSAAELHAFLAAHSRTPVPQPLSYLIDDVARRHGHLLVGAASAYVRCEDDALLAEIVADRRSEELRLRRLAPSVLVSQVAPDVLLSRLRDMGYAPAAEGEEGDVLLTRARSHRTPPRTAPAPVPDGPPVPGGQLLGAAVKALRAGERAATAARVPEPAAGTDRPGDSDAEQSPGLPRTTADETLATVQAAALTGGAVCIGYVNAEGAASRRVIAPVRVESGLVTAYDHTSDSVRTYPLHRITGVVELADDAASS